jgi:hypothetical protein
MMHGPLLLRRDEHYCRRFAPRPVASAPYFPAHLPVSLAAWSNRLVFGHRPSRLLALRELKIFVANLRRKLQVSFPIP